MADAEPTSGAPRALTAAEKRAARRARVLQGSESRLKLVTGQIASLKPEAAAQEASLERQLDAGVEELLTTASGANDGDGAASADGVAGLKVPTRVDPAQRRRDAALRRKKKEAAIQDLLSGGSSGVEAGADSVDSASAGEEAGESEKERSTAPSPVAAANTTVKAKARASTAFSRHSLALQLQVAQDKVVALALFSVAVYIAMTVDLRAILADFEMDDEFFLPYRELLARGIPFDSIKQRLERQHLLPEEQARIEQFLFTQQRSAALGSDVTPAEGILPNLWDVSALFELLVAHPPVIAGVFLARVAVATIAGAVHAALKLPDVKTPQEDDLGFVFNLALSSRPALKGYVVKMRKSVDDLFLFLFVLVVAVAARALWFA